MKSLTRLPIGEYREVAETRAMMIDLMREVEAITRAPKVQLDVEAGRRSEIESMVGVIGRKGSKPSIPTPTADLIYAALLPVDLKARS